MTVVFSFANDTTIDNVSLDQFTSTILEKCKLNVTTQTPPTTDTCSQDLAGIKNTFKAATPEKKREMLLNIAKSCANALKKDLNELFARIAIQITNQFFCQTHTINAISQFAIGTPTNASLDKSAEMIVTKCQL